MGCMGWTVLIILGALLVLFGGFYLFSALAIGFLKLLLSPYTLIAVIVLIGFIVLNLKA